MSKKFISWRRVSTFRQSKSGLGLEAQKEIIRYFVGRDGGELIADYSECYTGKELSGCKELRKAMEHCKKEGAILVIAKSDRFRNCQEALGILDEMGEGNLEFCDLPHSDRFTLTLFWALAEREALITSIRTKQALAAKKARGEKLGGASDAWCNAYKNKTKEQKEKEQMKRGKMKNERYLQSREVQVFFKVLKNVFGDVLGSDDPFTWDWTKVTTRGEYKERIINLMKDYKEMDETGTVFKRWDLDNEDKDKLRARVCAFIQNLRNAIKTNERLRNV